MGIQAGEITEVKVQRHAVVGICDTSSRRSFPESFLAKASDFDRRTNGCLPPTFGTLTNALEPRRCCGASSVVGFCGFWRFVRPVAGAQRIHPSIVKSRRHFT